MKRIIALIMVLILAVSLVGCTPNVDADQSSSASSKGKTSSAASSQSASSQPVAPVTLNTKDGAEFCLVPEGIVQYVEAAKNYDPDDFESSVAQTYMKHGMRPEPVNLSWNFDNNYTYSDIKVLVARSEDMSDAVEYPVDVNTIDIYNLMTGTTYYWCVKTNTDKGEFSSDIRSFKTDETPRLIRLSGIDNVRDIGGWKDKNGKAMNQGLAYRGKALTSITAEGIAAAKHLGIRTQFDLRKVEEFEADLVNGASKLGEDVKTVNVVATQYKDFLTTSITAKEIRVFADWSNYPIYFHCAGGADRTGSLAYLLQGLCGVEEPSLIMDYELTVYRDRSYLAFSKFVMAVRDLDGETTQEKLYNHCRKRFSLTHMELSNIYNIFMTESAVFDSNSLSSGKREANGVSFDLVLRKSGGVSSVKVNGADVQWSMKGNTLTVMSDAGEGVILLKDGAELKFSL